MLASTTSFWSLSRYKTSNGESEMVRLMLWLFMDVLSVPFSATIGFRKSTCMHPIYLVRHVCYVYSLYNDKLGRRFNYF
jgi:hypothetical protein